MTPPRHPTRGFEGDGEGNTPPPGVDVSTVIRIAEDKSRIAVGDHERDCGHITRVHMRLDTMEQTQKAHSDLWAQQKGAQRVILLVVPLLTTAAVSIAVALIQHFGRR
jgi:hypothetical protein